MNQGLRQVAAPESTATPADDVYVYAWGNNSRRAELKGRQCRVLARGGMNTVLVEFLDNGERVTTSRRAIRRVLG